MDPGKPLKNTQQHKHVYKHIFDKEAGTPGHMAAWASLIKVWYFFVLNRFFISFLLSAVAAASLPP